MQKIFRNPEVEKELEELCKVELREEMENFNKEFERSGRERLERKLTKYSMRELFSGYSPISLRVYCKNTYGKGGIN